jgi:hypothetical protein
MRLQLLVVLRVSAAILIATSFAACGRGPLQVTTIQLGRSLNPDNSVATHTTSFNTNDVIYVSVLTANSGTGTLQARWTYAGRLVDEPTKTVTYKGAAATEFHLQGAGGVPPGSYNVEIFLDGTSVGSRAFRVDK